MREKKALKKKDESSPKRNQNNATSSMPSDHHHHDHDHDPSTGHDESLIGHKEQFKIDKKVYAIFRND